MAKKPTLTDITAGYASSTQLNANNTAIEDAFDNTLSLDGSTPNAMAADLDMDSNSILNAQSISSVSMTLNGVGITPTSVAATPAASSIVLTDTGAFYATDDVESALAELGPLASVTSTAAELNILDGVTSTTAELNKLDGATASVTELNYVTGATSNIQTQLDTKAPLASPTLTGTPVAPTAAYNTDNTELATTAFVNGAEGVAQATIYGSNAAVVEYTASLNVATGTDHGTGDYSFTLTNAFSDNLYVQSSEAISAGARGTTRNSGRHSASIIAVEVWQGSGGANIDQITNNACWGPLA